MSPERNNNKVWTLNCGHLKKNGTYYNKSGPWDGSPQLLLSLAEKSCQKKCTAVSRILFPLMSFLINEVFHQ